MYAFIRAFMVPLLTRPHVQMVYVQMYKLYRLYTWSVVVRSVVVCGKGPNKTWCQLSTASYQSRMDGVQYFKDLLELD